MSDGREERQERERRIEQEKREDREDRIDRKGNDDWEPETSGVLDGQRCGSHNHKAFSGAGE